MADTMRFGDVLEAAEQLSLQEQRGLIDILDRRLSQADRQRLVADVEQARQEFAQGRTRPATPDEVMREIWSVSRDLIPHR